MGYTNIPSVRVCNWSSATIMGTNIYSLGVCLLEISLWELFFAQDKQPSCLYRDTVINLGYIKANNNSVTEFTKPQLVPQVLQALAENEFPQRMSLYIPRLIVSCLTCIDEGPGERDLRTALRAIVHKLQ